MNFLTMQFPLHLVGNWISDNKCQGMTEPQDGESLGHWVSTWRRPPASQEHLHWIVVQARNILLLCLDLCTFWIHFFFPSSWYHPLLYILHLVYPKIHSINYAANSPVFDSLKHINPYHSQNFLKDIIYVVKIKSIFWNSKLRI